MTSIDHARQESRIVSTDAGKNELASLIRQPASSGVSYACGRSRVVCLGSAAQAYDDTVCRVRNYTDLNTTCACDAAALAALDGGSGGGGFTSGSAAMLAYFASLFDVEFGAALFLNNLLLLFAFGTILLYGALNFAFGWRQDRIDAAALAAEKAADEAEAAEAAAANAAETAAAAAERKHAHEEAGRSGQPVAAHAHSHHRSFHAHSHKSSGDFADESLPPFVTDKRLVATLGRVVTATPLRRACPDDRLRSHDDRFPSHDGGRLRLPSVAPPLTPPHRRAVTAIYLRRNIPDETQTTVKYSQTARGSITYTPHSLGIAI